MRRPIRRHRHRVNPPVHSRIGHSAGYLVESIEPRVLLSTYSVSNLNDTGAGSLRDAVAQANAHAGPDTINFAAGLAGEVTLTSGPLSFSDTTGPTTINGADGTLAVAARISTNQTLVIGSGAAVQLQGLDVFNGNVINDGSLSCVGSVINAPSPVIDNGHGTLSLRDCRVYVETTSTSRQFAILSVGGAVSVFDSALDIGGFDASVHQGTGSLTIVQSTVNDVDSSGLLTVADSTINGSVTLSPSAGVDNATLYNTIVTQAVNGPLDQHPAAGQAPSSYNLIGSPTAAGGLVNGTNGNIVGQDPDVVVSTGDTFGGDTLTMPPRPASPAIGAGRPDLALDYTANPPAPLTLDQRGFARTVGGKIDIGAVEDQPLLVNATNDNLAFGQFSLAAASRLINAMQTGGRIAFDPAVFTPGSLHTITGAVTIGNNFGPVTLVGPGPDVLAIQGGESALTTQGTGAVLLENLTLLGHGGPGFGQLLENRGALLDIQDVSFLNAGTHDLFNSGMVTANDCQFTGTIAGAAVYNAGTAAFQDCTFANNANTSTSLPFGSGGAINNQGALSVVDCTFAGNSSAHGAGGAIENFDGANAPVRGTTLTAINCTFTANSAAAGEGAIDCNFTSSVSGNACTITNCTIVGNTGGGVSADGSTTLNNTIVAGNTAADGMTPMDVAGSIAGSNNLIGTGGSGGLVNGTDGNLVGVANPMLGPLSDNGGPTQTMALLPGSPAIDAGSNALAVDANGQPLPTDQRGQPRISNGTADIGAYELQQTRLAVPEVTGGSGASVPLSAVLTVDGKPVAGETVQFSLLGKPVGTAATDATGTATLRGVSLAGVSPGTYPSAIAVTFAGDLTYAASAAMGDLAVAVSDPVPVGVAINDGSAQRSEVRSVTLRFGQPVTLAPGAVTLALLNAGGSGANDGAPPTDASAALGAPTTFDGGLSWVFAFALNTPFTDSTGSLADGIYTLTINEAKVTTANDESLSGASTGFTFHRLFGDINGDGQVSNADYFLFRKAFNTSSGDAGYNAAFDYNGDGQITNADYFQFRKRFLMSFSY